MSIQATEAVAPGIFGPAAPSASTQSANKDKDMFLQLMVAQMRYQDPLNPAESGEFLAQSAQFTALEKMQAVADQTAMLLSTQLAFGAAGMVGRQVSWTDAQGVQTTGLVNGVAFGAQGPVLDVDGANVPLASVVSVTSAGSGQTPAAPGTPTTTP